MELTRVCIAQKSLEVHPGRGALKAAFAFFFLPPACGRHEGLGLCWLGFGEFVTLDRKPRSFPKDMQQPGCREAGSGTCCRRPLCFDRSRSWLPGAGL